MRLRVDQRSGQVLLTVPKRVSQRRALEWAAEHRDWVEEMLARLPQRIAIAPQATIPFRGEAHRIDWSKHLPRTVRSEAGRLVVGGPQEAVEARVLRWLKGEARRLLSEDTRHFAGLAGVDVARVGIGDPSSRWGSCSTSGTIRYSWRLVMAPDFVRRATAAHEVAHRVHMNHGPHFHALVEELLGSDPTPARAWLKREGAALHRIGSA